MKCAVIVAAYKASKFIMECLESIEAQLPAPGWEYEVRVGVDGCLDTASTLREHGIEFHWSGWNAGSYIMRNSLVGLGHVDAYAIFDADDRMLPGYLSKLLAETPGIAGAARADINESGKRTGNIWDFVSGVAVYSRSAWEMLGGYRPWRVIADHDMIQRARALGISYSKCREVLYERRRHPGCITASDDLGMHSAERDSYRRLSEKLIRKGWFKVNPTTAPLTYVNREGAVCL